MTERLKALTQGRFFQGATVLLILLSAVIMGVEALPEVMRVYGQPIHAVAVVIQALFVLEIVLRLLSYGSRPGEFFRDGWNVFDFVIVAVSLLPAAGPMATVVRLARILRVVRLISRSTELKLIIETMLRSIPSLGNVSVLLGLLMYVYSVLGFHLFHRVDPLHWGDLWRSLGSVFQMLTLEGWVEMQRAVVEQMPGAWIFFASYILLAVFVVVNLFIAVVLNNLEQARAHQIKPLSQGEMVILIQDVRDRLDRIEQGIRSEVGSASSKP